MSEGWTDYRIRRLFRAHDIGKRTVAARAAADAADAAEEERLLAEGWGPWLGWHEDEEPTARRGKEQR